MRKLTIDELELISGGTISGHQDVLELDRS